MFAASPNLVYTVACGRAEGKDIDIQDSFEVAQRLYARPPDALLALEGEGTTSGYKFTNQHGYVLLLVVFALLGR